MLTRFLRRSLYFRVFFWLYLGMIAYIIPTIFMAPTYLLFNLVSFRLTRWYNDLFAAGWFILSISLLENVFGVKHVITVEGDVEKFATERTIIISNHTTGMDWMFLWSFIMRLGFVGKNKIMLKRYGKFVPGPGWAMQGFNFFFLHRKWEADQMLVKRGLEYYRKLKYQINLLIFPEGTDRDKPGIAASARYAAKMGIKNYEYVLHPRTTGFVYTVQNTRGYVDAIYDIDIAYPDFVPSHGFDFIFKRFPKEVHINVKRVPISELPKDKEGIAEWLIEDWKRKEETQREFYRYKKFNKLKLEVNEKHLRIKKFFVFFGFLLSCYILYYLLVSYRKRFMLYLLAMHFIWWQISKVGLEDIERRVRVGPVEKYKELAI